MSTPKEKAIELVQKYEQIDFLKDFDGIDMDLAKQCALIAVEEIIKESSNHNTTIRFKGCSLTDKEYWQEVKQEIEKL